MTSSARTLLLLRHATAEPGRPGRPGARDADRPLSTQGRTEAAGVGAFLRTAGLRVDHVLCSPAVRTRETLAGLGLDAGPQGPVVELARPLYQASADELLELVATVAATTVLVVGHAPAVPTTVGLLAGPGSAAAASAAVASRYPPGTLARLWSASGAFEPQSADLVGVRLPSGADGRYFR